MILRNFEDTATYLDYSAGPTDAENRSSRRYCRDGFNVTASYADALRLAREGWVEGRDQVAALARSLSGIVASKIARQSYTWDVSGDVVDVGRFCEGCPENMIRFEETEQEGHGKLLTLGASFSAAVTIPPAEIIRRGAVLCALVDALESVGHRVEIIITNTVRDNAGARHGTTVVVKRHADPVDVDRLAFILCHPDMLRRIHFSAQEREPREARRRFGFDGHYYGYPDDTPIGDIYFPCLKDSRLGEYATDARALEILIGELRRQGVEVAD
jgi:hypothetical protein